MLDMIITIMDFKQSLKRLLSARLIPGQWIKKIDKRVLHVTTCQVKVYSTINFWPGKIVLCLLK